MNGKLIAAILGIAIVAIGSAVAFSIISSTPEPSTSDIIDSTDDESPVASNETQGKTITIELSESINVKGN